MKAAQQLVFGEQLGWIDASIIQEKENADHLKRLAEIRYAFRDLFAHGEMERPPRLSGDIPTVAADWQWMGEWPVTESALQRGAWRAQDGRLVLFFLNTSDEEIATTLEFDGTRTKTLYLPMRTEHVYLVRSEHRSAGR